MSISAAKSRVSMAREYYDMRRYDEVEPTLSAAEGFLVGQPEEDTEPLIADIAAIRALMADVIMPDDERKINAAKRNLVRAEEMMAAGNIALSGIEETIQGAENYLEGVTEKHAVAVRDQIAALRTLLDAGAKAQSAAAGPSESGVPANALTPEMDVAISRANNRIRQARTAVESGWTDGIDEILAEATSFLDGIPEVIRSEMLSEMDVIRAEARGAAVAEAVRKADERLGRYLSSAESQIDGTVRYAYQALSQFAEAMQDEDLVGPLPPETIERFNARAVDIRTRLDARVKEEALRRAMPTLRELEERLATDPFAGLDQHAAYVLTGELATLKERVQHDVKQVPNADSDPDVQDVHARLAATDKKIEAGTRAWGIEALHAQVAEGWDMVRRDIDGWREEQEEDDDTGGGTLQAPYLPLTRAAVRRLRFYVTDEQNQKMRAEHPDDETVQGIYAAADAAFAEAADKMYAAYQRILDEADTFETPMGGMLRDAPLHLKGEAETVFEGTVHKEAVVGRIQGLRDKWEAEIAAIMAGREELADKLAAEAAENWPKILASLGAVEEFYPGASAAGSTVLLSGVHNRAGWDFNNYDFAMRINGVPIGGSYAPHVTAALEHVWYELKLGVSDRIPWDLVAVVEGGGKIAERTHKTLKSASTGLEIGKIEEWPAVDCVRLRIIALHAGPVAVGPQGEG